MTLQLFQKETRPNQNQELSNNHRRHQSVRIIRTKTRYEKTDINSQVKLFPDLNVLLIQRGREYHYQCLQCGYHSRVNSNYNRDHKHDRYPSLNKSKQPTLEQSILCIR